MSLAFYDDLGYLYNAQFSIHNQDGDNGKFYIQLDRVINSSSKEDVTNEIGAAFGLETYNVDTDPQTYTMSPDQLVEGYKMVNDAGGNKIIVKLNDDGTLPDPLPATGETPSESLYDFSDYEGVADLALNPATGVLTFTGKKIASQAAALNFDPNNGYFTDINGGETAKLSFTSDAFSTVTIDFTNMTMFNNNGTSTAGVTSGNVQGLGTGRRLGELSGVSVAKDGVITGSYDNGQTKILGQIAVAQFANAAGLEKSGDNLYVSTPNSGEFDGIGIDITANGDYMTSGVLEMSNVDLANEFTTMITTQRGFQANSRIITVSDTLLEELTNLKR